MDIFSQTPTGIKVTFYTHPLCTISREMHQDWLRFCVDYQHVAQCRICIAPPAVDTMAVSFNNPYLCLSLKAASLQSGRAANLYLARLADAFFDEDKDLSGPDELIHIARGLGQQHRHDFDFNRFVSGLTSKDAARSLNEDLRKCHINRINNLPTTTFTHQGKGIKLDGKRSYDQLGQALKRLEPSLSDDCTKTKLKGMAESSALQKAPAQLVR